MKQSILFVITICNRRPILRVFGGTCKHCSRGFYQVNYETGDKIKQWSQFAGKTSPPRGRCYPPSYFWFNRVLHFCSNKCQAKNSARRWRGSDSKDWVEQQEKFSPRLSWSSLVNFELRYGMWVDFESTRALITFPSVERDKLILEASFNP